MYAIAKRNSEKRGGAFVKPKIPTWRGVEKIRIGIFKDVLPDLGSIQNVEEVIRPFMNEIANFFQVSQGVKAKLIKKNNKGFKAPDFFLPLCPTNNKVADSQ